MESGRREAVGRFGVEAERRGAGAVAGGDDASRRGAGIERRGGGCDAARRSEAVGAATTDEEPG